MNSFPLRSEQLTSFEFNMCVRKLIVIECRDDKRRNQSDFLMAESGTLIPDSRWMPRYSETNITQASTAPFACKRDRRCCFCNRIPWDFLLCASLHHDIREVCERRGRGSINLNANWSCRFGSSKSITPWMQFQLPWLLTAKCPINRLRNLIPENRIP